jgi:dTDP-4-amino-4,6-dideoxygalactose transaminase
VGQPDHVPFVDLAIQHAQVGAAVEEGWRQVLDATAFILGDAVSTFEQEFAAYCGVRQCVGVANGTDALELALRAVGVGPGDEVVLPANTFIASAVAVARIGAVPVPADVDDHALLLEPAAAAAAVTARTKAVMPVHLFGQLAPAEALADLGVSVIEDAAQCQGATRHGRQAGQFGRAAATSFYPGKNLGAYGDAGAVLSDDDETGAKVRRLRNYGSEVRYHHPELGFNSRLDTLQAVVLSAKLARLEEWNRQRREAADRYAELLAGVDGVRLPVTADGNVHVWHLYVVRVDGRDEVLSRLQAEGIGSAIHYPVPVHLHGAFAHLGYGPGSFPVAEAAARQILSLPMFPGITAAQQERVAEVLAKAVQ